jgi:hypothetical protein
LKSLSQDTHCVESTQLLQLIPHSPKVASCVALHGVFSNFPGVVTLHVVQTLSEVAVHSADINSPIEHTAQAEQTVSALLLHAVEAK